MAGALASDGANIWVTNLHQSSVIKIRASDGTRLGIFPVGLRPGCTAFDGTNLWISNNQANTVTELLTSDGVEDGTFRR